MLKKGITLVSLVITIVILLILATVAISAAIDSKGLFKRTEEAVDKYNISSEREYLEQNVLLYQLNKVTNNTEEMKLGEPLHNKNSINDSTWFVIQLLNDTKKIYGDNYSYLIKGTDIKNYGYTKYNWIINYETGEVINIGEEKKDYIKMAWNSGIAVTEDLPLNINPLNMSNSTSWGNNVKFIGGNDNQTSGYNGTEIKFDGEDDYLKLESVNIQKNEGFTFEFYGKNYGSDIYPLEKTIFEENGGHGDYGKNFRISIEPYCFRCCFSPLNADSDKKENDTTNTHWLRFSEVKLSAQEDYDYITMVVDYTKNTVTLYSKGKCMVTTTCSHDYLVDSTLNDSTIPFTVGLQVAGNVENFSKFDLYACRLYTKVLTEKQIKENYEETVSYHNYLVDTNNQ